MRVVSVNVGLPREVVWRGKPVTTGIYKEPVTGRVPLRRTNLDGDRQADLLVHGGPEKAGYAYPSEFYELWSRERPELVFGPGTFGENLTTEGLLDGDVSIGDRFRFGTAELVVTQPRLPCFKLGIKMGREEFVTEFLERGLYGFYLAVAREGDVEAGDPIVALSRDPHGFGINELARLYVRDRNDVESMRRAAELDVLPESWRNYFRKRMTYGRREAFRRRRVARLARDLSSQQRLDRAADVRPGCLELHRCNASIADCSSFAPLRNRLRRGTGQVAGPRLVLIADNEAVSVEPGWPSSSCHF